MGGQKGEWAQVVFFLGRVRVTVANMVVYMITITVWYVTTPPRVTRAIPASGHWRFFARLRTPTSRSKQAAPLWPPIIPRNPSRAEYYWNVPRVPNAQIALQNADAAQKLVDEAAAASVLDGGACLGELERMTAC